MFPWTVILCLSILVHQLIFPISAMLDDELGYIDYRRLFCPAELPRVPYGPINTATWPYGLSGAMYVIRDILREQNCDYYDWSWMNFTSLADLCSAQGNPNGNMGGMVRTYRHRTLLCASAS